MIELQDILRKYIDEYLKIHQASYMQLKTINAILKCRTHHLGGHSNVCKTCGNVELSYNSCRNRHCPKCQTFAKEQWIENRKSDLLNVGYFHVVFTLPSELNMLIYNNQTECYNILFKAVSETLNELCNDPKYLGAKSGFTCILHTWGQNLNFHPHIHCIIPGGGITADKQWRQSKKKFFIPVRVLSKVFRGKFLYYLKQAELPVPNEAIEFQNLMNLCYQKDPVVYCKQPFKTANCVIEYLGRYTHRIAISNNRILSFKDGMVTFKWRDYRDKSKWKLMTLTAVEFIRRFLMHILPHRFTKIRHYGFLASKNKFTILRVCQYLTNSVVRDRVKLHSSIFYEKLFGKKTCPNCGGVEFKRLPLPPPTN